MWISASTRKIQTKGDVNSEMGRVPLFHMKSSFGQTTARQHTNTPKTIILRVVTCRTIVVKMEYISITAAKRDRRADENCECHCCATNQFEIYVDFVSELSVSVCACLSVCCTAFLSVTSINRWHCTRSDRLSILLVAASAPVRNDDGTKKQQLKSQ